MTDELVQLTLLSGIVERTTEVVAAPFFNRYGWPKEFQKHVALVLGIGLALLGHLNLVAAFLPGLTLDPLIAETLTGVAIGGGGTILHATGDALQHWLERGRVIMPETAR